MRIANCRAKRGRSPKSGRGWTASKPETWPRCSIMQRKKQVQQQQLHATLAIEFTTLSSTTSSVRRDRATPPEISMRTQASTKSVLIQLACVTFQFVHLPTWIERAFCKAFRRMMYRKSSVRHAAETHGCESLKFINRGGMTAQWNVNKIPYCAPSVISCL